jgi:hypothetical protein
VPAALRLDAFDITQRARDASSDAGRLSLPVQVEDCWTCREPDEAFVWTDERWLVGMSSEPLSVPAVMPHPRAHLDFHDLSEALGADLGVLLVRAQRALTSIEGSAGSTSRSGVTAAPTSTCSSSPAPRG